MPNSSLTWDDLKRLDRSVLIGWAVVVAVFLYTYSERLVWFFDYAKTDDYQFCFVVPLFAVFLLWYRRDVLGGDLPSGFSYWSLPCFALWGFMRWFHAYYYYPTLDGYSWMPFFAGMTLALGGWQAMRWAWPSLLFLFFMFPLPSPIHDLFRLQLQGLATKASVFLIQTMGIPAASQGNAIHLSEGPPLEVANVCSGLRMLMLFVTCCVGAAFILRGPLWQKIVIVLSAVPIAIFANVARITATGIQREYWNSDYLNEHFHDMAGLAMMPLALLLTWGGIALLNKLFPEERLDSPLMLSTSRPERGRRPATPAS